jgi:hypothetical protein
VLGTARNPALAANMKWNSIQEVMKMRQNANQRTVQLSGAIVALLLLGVCISDVQAWDYRFGYPGIYFHPNDYFGFRQDINELEEKMRYQQRVIEEQTQQQQEQTRLLRQQQTTRHQITAMQACYYRFNGGLDLCDSLFDALSREHAACVAKAVELNPGCATDIAGYATRPGK